MPVEKWSPSLHSNVRRASGPQTGLRAQRAASCFLICSSLEAVRRSRLGGWVRLAVEIVRPSYALGSDVRRRVRLTSVVSSGGRASVRPAVERGALEVSDRGLKLICWVFSNSRKMLLEASAFVDSRQPRVGSPAVS